MNSEENIALIDLDGTLADFDSAMKLALERMRSPAEPPYVGRGIDEELPPWLEARAERVKSTPGFWRGLAPIPLGMITLDLIVQAGYQLNILTKASTKHTNSWTEKVEWVKAHVLDKYEAKITITQDKGLSYGKVLFDDWPPYILRWLKWRPRGLVLMLDQPWNERFFHPNVFRMWNTPEIPRTCLAALQRRLTSEAVQ